METLQVGNFKITIEPNKTQYIGYLTDTHGETRKVLLTNDQYKAIQDAKLREIQGTYHAQVFAELTKRLNKYK